MSDTYTCSVWIVPEGRHDEFVAAFKDFAAAATQGGAGKGFILQDDDDPSRLIVVRRWESAEAVERWQDNSRRLKAGEALRKIVPEAQAAYLASRIADLGAATDHATP